MRLRISRSQQDSVKNKHTQANTYSEPARLPVWTRALHASPVIQTRLTVNAPGDRYEREADRVADQVMRQVDPEEEEEKLVQTQALAGTITPLVMRQVDPEEEEEELVQTQALTGTITPSVMRQIDPEEEEEELVQAKRSAAHAGGFTAPAVAHRALRSPGRPLDGGTRAFMEPRFGRDFGAVRVHTDAQAAESARAIGARAFTSGRDVVFGAGEYAPHTRAGQKLIAHELTHVVQQSHQGGHSRIAPFIQLFPATTPHGRPNTPGVMHDHRSSGLWPLIQSIEGGNCRGNPIACFCAVSGPLAVLTTAAAATMRGKPLARAHVTHFLSGGGVDYAENVTDFITRDAGVRAKLARHASARPRGHFKVQQSDYSVQDFRYAFGAIDRLDYEVDSAASRVHVWFVDRYEWHPVYPGIYMKKSGDAARITNCVHAAGVELKASGASDYWMVGYGTVPLSMVTGGGAGGGGRTL
jgi:hypothetical protein